MRKAPDQHVLLVAAPSEAGEWEVIVNQLQEWNEEQGYAWDDMAVLARSKQQVKQAAACVC
jgi:superfamily I DNA/RNA helicase